MEINLSKKFNIAFYSNTLSLSVFFRLAGKVLVWKITLNHLLVSLVLISVTADVAVRKIHNKMDR